MSTNESAAPKSDPGPRTRRWLAGLLPLLGALGIGILLVQVARTPLGPYALPSSTASFGRALGFWFQAGVNALPILAAVLTLSLTSGALLAMLSLYGPPLFETLLRRLHELGGALPALLLLMLWRLGDTAPTALGFVLLLGALNSIEVARLLARGAVREPSRSSRWEAPDQLITTGRRFLVDASVRLRPQLATHAALVAASVFGLDAALAFVGLGLTRTPTWGGLVGTAARTHEVSALATWLATLSILVSVLAVHRLLARALNTGDELPPSSR